MNTLSICMIVKNEELVLDRCLKSLGDIYDELIIVDTGSTDSTKEIALKYTDKVFDFEWTDDFSAARNFSFGKATMDYIYIADADEVIDENNRNKLKSLISLLLDEIDIVQMYYINSQSYNTTENFEKELRPKLFKRLRKFVWIDPVHESVRLSPLVFDSDIEILHSPASDHSKRDFQIFLKVFSKNRISKKLLSMYAKELFIAGSENDFLAAENIFLAVLNDPERTEDELTDASCVIARILRIKKEYERMLSICLDVISTNPCSEICIELAEYFFTSQNFHDAKKWFYNAKNNCLPFIYKDSQEYYANEGISRCELFIK